MKRPKWMLRLCLISVLLLSLTACPKTEPTTNQPKPDASLELVVGGFNAGENQLWTHFLVYYNIPASDFPAANELVTLSIKGPASWGDGTTFTFQRDRANFENGWTLGFSTNAVVAGTYTIETTLNGKVYTGTTTITDLSLLQRPQGLTVNTFSKSNVSASWQPVPGAQSYYVGLLSVDRTKLVAVKYVKETTVDFANLDLTPTDYFVEVGAYNFDATAAKPPKPTIAQASYTPSVPFGITSNPFNVSTEATTDAAGNATLIVDTAQINVNVADKTTLAAVVNVQVFGIPITEHYLVWVHDDAGQYFDDFQVIPYTELADDNSGLLEPQLAVVTLAFAVVTTIGLLDGLYELVTTPPAIDIVFNDAGLDRVCVTADVDDVVNAFGVASDFKVIGGVLKVLGAPARVRGVTAINFGFTRKELLKGELKNYLEDRLVELIDTRITGCYLAANGRALPAFDFTIDCTDLQITDGITQIYQVTPRGTYDTQTTETDLDPVTFISREQIGIPAGECIKFERIGSWRASPPAPDEDPNSGDDKMSMVGVFTSGGLGQFIVPGSNGSFEPVVTLFTDIAQDFWVYSSGTIVQFPKDATGIYLSPNSQRFDDNSDPNGDYSVRISY